MAAIRDLGAAKAARGDLDALALLKALIADIESGEELSPDRLAVVIYRKGKERDTFYVSVRYTSPRGDDAIGLLEMGKLHVWSKVTAEG